MSKPNIQVSADEAKQHAEFLAGRAQLIEGFAVTAVQEIIVVMPIMCMYNINVPETDTLTIEELIKHMEKTPISFAEYRAAMWKWLLLPGYADMIQRALLDIFAVCIVGLDTKPELGVQFLEYVFKMKHKGPLWSDLAPQLKGKDKRFPIKLGSKLYDATIAGKEDPNRRIAMFSGAVGDKFTFSYADKRMDPDQPEDKEDAGSDKAFLHPVPKLHPLIEFVDVCNFPTVVCWKAQQSDNDRQHHLEEYANGTWANIFRGYAKEKHDRMIGEGHRDEAMALLNWRIGISRKRTTATLQEQYKLHPPAKIAEMQKKCDWLREWDYSSWRDVKPYGKRVLMPRRAVDRPTPQPNYFSFHVGDNYSKWINDPFDG